MKWMKHQKNARTNKPLMVTINESGQALFNAKSKKQAIKDAKYVEIFFGANTDADGVCAIGFKFLTAQSDESTKLKFGGPTLSQISCSIGGPASRQVGVRKGLIAQIPLDFDSSSGLWFIDFTKKVYVNTDSYIVGHEKARKN